MKVSLTRMGGVTVLAPKGAIAQEAVADFAASVEEERAKSDGRLVIELSEVSFFDSQGIETLWDFADRQRDGGQTAKVAAVPELCREIFELTGVAKSLDCFDTAQSAAKSFL